ncbi:MAG: hypothetical protein ACTSRG_15700 [Candidatus Helarchaeota archaeon]
MNFIAIRYAEFLYHELMFYAGLFGNKISNLSSSATSYSLDAEVKSLIGTDWEFYLRKKELIPPKNIRHLYNGIFFTDKEMKNVSGIVLFYFKNNLIKI